MKPDKFTVFELFERERRYLVPLYQRPYVWEQDGQWEPLWLDIADKADLVLDADAERDGIRNHFLGAVVLNRVGTFGKEVAADEIIDGQQRLTTLQIFMAALRDVAARTSDSRLIGGLQRVTENDCLRQDDVERFKVWPTNADRSAYESVLTSGSVGEVKRRHPQRFAGRKEIARERLVEAYLFFSARIEEYATVREDGASAATLSTERLTALFQVLRRNLQLVVIELEPDDDPQVIFETLNARGQPLLPSDLIRNFAFLQATRMKEDVDRLYNKFWLPYDQTPAEPGAAADVPFWKQSERQGRLERPRIDLFFFHYLTYQAERDINIGHLFQEFREWWNRDRATNSVEEELASLQAHSAIFTEFFLPNRDTRLGLFVDRLRVLDTTTVYPLLLFLLSEVNDVPFTEQVAIIEDLESFLVRRMVCELTTKNYNRLFLGLLKKMRAAERVDCQMVRQELLSATGDAVRWPSDQEFVTQVLTSPVYARLKPHRVSMLLQAVERRLRTAKQEDVVLRGKVSVEHVLPQEYRGEDYPFPVEETSSTPDDRIAKRQSLLHSLGNLTLLTQPLNASLGNAAFSKKRREIAIQSSLRLNAYFQEMSDHDVWNESEIFKRGIWLAKELVGIWPHPTSNFHFEVERPLSGRRS